MIPIDLTGSTVLVTGAAGGLGSALVERFLQAGATVVAQSRRPSATNSSRRDSSRLLSVIGDLEDEDFVDSMFSREAEYGAVDVLVNNAGAYPTQPLLDTSVTRFDQVLRSNIGITFSSLRAAAASMRERSEGCIINIASLNATRPAPGQAAYNSAKSAVVALTRSAAYELGQHGIRVNAVSPGLIDRPGLAEQWPSGVQSWLERCPTGRVGTPRDVADACLFLASPLAGWITGQELIVDGGTSVGPAY